MFPARRSRVLWQTGTGNLSVAATAHRRNPVLDEMVRRLVETYSPERIYLFGSAARGDSGPDSDYDLMVVVPDSNPAELRDCGPGYRALRGMHLAKDILVWTRSDFEVRTGLRASLPATILREGILLYDAGTGSRE